MAQKIGGSFAPPLSDDKLASYKTLIEAQPESATKDALGKLLTCVQKWWELPDSDGAAASHPATTRMQIVDLTPEIAKTLWDYIPWKEELTAMQALFDVIPATQAELRNCAFHLLWFGIELEKDREPLTNDKLAPQ